MPDAWRADAGVGGPAQAAAQEGGSPDVAARQAAVAPFGLALSASLGAIFVAVLVAIITLNGGRLIYSLDDPYIHLALAEELLRGHHGINPGEPSSPSSSVLYPLLMAAGLALGLGEAAPLVVNAVASIGLVLALACFVRDVGIPIECAPRSLLLAVSVVVVFCFNLVGLALTGLEHSLHLLITAGAILGLIPLATRGRTPSWWLACVVLQPFVRFEGTAVLLAAAVVLGLCGRWRTALGVLGAAGVVMAGYVLWMTSQGLPPLPSSVLVKSGSVAAGSSGNVFILIVRLLREFRANLFTRPGLLILMMLLVFAATLLRSRHRLFHDRGGGLEMIIAAFCAIVLAAHLVMGRMGWFERYEVYALLTGSLGLVALSRGWLSRTAMLRPGVAWPALGLFGAMAVFSPYVLATVLTPWASANVYRQQYQMHRFLVLHYKRPVAVIDLGWVSFRNDAYVLDLWGLGSEEARKARETEAAPGWVDRLTREHNVDLAVLDDAGLPKRPSGWVPVGYLTLGMRQVSIGGDTVTFYATRPEAVPLIAQHLRAFGETLPAGPQLTILSPTP